MREDNLIGKRLREERKRVGRTQQEFSVFGNVSAKSQSFYENGNSVPDASYLSFMCDVIDVLYVLTGTKTSGGIYSQPSSDNATSQGWGLQFDQIPLYKVGASAGRGAGSNGSYDMSTLAFPKNWFETRNLNSTNLLAIDIAGDSMEPLIPDGSVVLLDKTLKKPENGWIYVFEMGDDILIKQIVRTEHGYNAISINKLYPDLPINQTTSNCIIGRAVRALPDIKL